MSRKAAVPPQLRDAPFRVSVAIHHGLVTWSMIRGPSWRRLFKGVYIHADAFDPGSHRMWCRAVALTLHPHAAIDRYSAAFLRGVDLLPEDAPVHVTVPQGTQPRPHPRRRVFQAALEPEDILELDGMRVTSPVRTAFDLGRQPDRDEAVIALDALCRRGLVTVPDIGSYLEGRDHLLGAQDLRARLPLVEPLAGSPVETRLRLLLHDAGAPPPTARPVIRCDDGELHAGLSYEQWRIAMVCEDGPQREIPRSGRDAAGWLVLRFTAQDVQGRPRHTLERIRRAIVGQAAASGHRPARRTMRPVRADERPATRHGRVEERQPAARHGRPEERPATRHGRPEERPAAPAGRHGRPEERQPARHGGPEARRPAGAQLNRRIRAGAGA